MENDKIYFKIEQQLIQIFNDKPIGEKCHFHKTVINETIEKVNELYGQLIAAKEKAEESSHLKTAFLNNVSHEFRTPMNGILGFVDLFLKPSKTEKQRRMYAEVIKESCENLLNIVTDTIEISQIQTNTSVIKKTEFDLKALIDTVIETIKHKADKKKIELKLINKCPENQTLIYSDREKIFRSITHLIDNAIKFTENGFVEIECNQENNKTEIKITDSGIGISKDKQSFIFDVYRQNETGLARKYSGNGIGLTLVKSYIDLIGGQIQLQSEINKGTCITISLPNEKITNFTEISKQEKIETNNFENKTILIAEDEEMTYLYLEELLSETKANILYAPNGQEAVNLCRDGASIDLILMDIKMPIMDGHQATKIIKQFRGDIPIIAQTAFALDNDKIKFLESGFDAHLAKPISEEELIETIQKFIK